MFDNIVDPSNFPFEFNKEELTFAPTQSEYDKILRDAIESGRPLTANEMRKCEAFRSTWQYFWNRRQLDRERV